jgi:hypothetical protein
MVDPSAGGYHLQANSPAIGAGTSLDEVVYDFDGRSYNQPPSIGAFAADPLDQPVYLPLVLR